MLAVIAAFVVSLRMAPSSLAIWDSRLPKHSLPVGS